MKSPTPEHIVMIAIPCYEQKVYANTMVSIVGGAIRMSHRGWGCGIETFGGNAGIHLIRNWFCMNFLRSPCTDLFFIDNDIAFQPDDMVRMIAHPVDVVMGLYRARREPETYAFMSHESNYIDPDTGLLLVRAGPAGFLRIRRHVIQKMADSLRPDQWAPLPNFPDENMPTLFNFDQRHGHYIGEDMFFCLLWESLGGKVWVDPEVELIHSGTQPYTSTFGDVLREAQKAYLERKRFEEIVGG